MNHITNSQLTSSLPKGWPSSFRYYGRLHFSRICLKCDPIIVAFYIHNQSTINIEGNDKKKQTTWPVQIVKNWLGNFKSNNCKKFLNCIINLLQFLFEIRRGKVICEDTRKKLYGCIKILVNVQNSRKFNNFIWKKLPDVTNRLVI